MNSGSARSEMNTPHTVDSIRIPGYIGEIKGDLRIAFFFSWGRRARLSTAPCSPPKAKGTSHPEGSARAAAEVLRPPHVPAENALLYTLVSAGDRRERHKRLAQKRVIVPDVPDSGINSVGVQGPVQVIRCHQFLRILEGRLRVEPGVPTVLRQQ